MKIRHKSGTLASIEADASFNAQGTYSKGVIRGYRKAMGYLRQAVGERDIRKLKSLHYHKLQAPRDHQHAVDVSDQFRLILEWEGSEETKTLVIVDIEDYH